MNNKAQKKIGRVTIVDVARVAGVDNSTVSLALRSDPRITDKTRKRVMDAARQLNYKPNHLARSLSGGATRVLGVMLPDMHHFFNEPLEQFHAVSQKAGYALSVNFCAWDQQRETHGLARFEGKWVDGILWAPSLTANDQFKQQVKQLQESELSWVMLGLTSSVEPEPFHQVGVRTRDSVQLGLEYLLELGHRRIAVATATGSQGMHGQFHRTRLKTIREVFVHLGIELAEDDVLQTHDNDFGGVELASRIASRSSDNRPTAIFAADDNLARGLVYGLHVLNIKIPQQISVMGHDGSPGSLTGPMPLTTVSLEAGAVASQAMDLLLKDIGCKTAPAMGHTIVLRPRLLERATCGPVAQG